MIKWTYTKLKKQIGVLTLKFLILRITEHFKKPGVVCPTNWWELCGWPGVLNGFDWSCILLPFTAELLMSKSNESCEKRWLKTSSCEGVCGKFCPLLRLCSWTDMRSSSVFISWFKKVIYRKIKTKWLST